MSASSDFRRRYPLFVELGLLLALALVIAAFVLPFGPRHDVTVVAPPDEFIEAVEIPATIHQRTLPPPPAPIEVPNDEIVDDEIDIPPIPDEPIGPVAIPDLPDLPDPPTTRAEPPEPEIFVVVEDEPVLIGGLDGLQRRVVYPELARRVGIEGTVFVQFVVDEQGAVTQARVLRDPGGGLGEAALRAVRGSAFEPGRQRGRPVKVQLSLPVKFCLR